MNFLVSLFLVLLRAANSKENCLQFDGQQPKFSLADQTKLKWLACYLLSYNFLESERVEIEQISKELAIPFKQTGLKLANEFIQSYNNTLSVDESKMILSDPENANLIFSMNTKYIKSENKL